MDLKISSNVLWICLHFIAMLHITTKTFTSGEREREPESVWISCTAFIWRPFSPIGVSMFIKVKPIIDAHVPKICCTIELSTFKSGSLQTPNEKSTIGGTTKEKNPNIQSKIINIKPPNWSIVVSKPKCVKIEMNRARWCTYTFTDTVRPESPRMRCWC